MKTLTEFDGFSIQRALNTKKELLAAGKTAEELPAAMGEALKLEGDKLTYFLNALELAETKPDGLKRVVVYAIEEGKSAPQGSVLKGDKHFRLEHFYTHQPKPARPERDARGGGKGKKDGDRKKRGGRGGGGGRRPDQSAGGKPGEPLVAGAPVKPGGGDRPPRVSRPPREQAPKNDKPVVVPVTPKS
jgi:hypothetical protein